jgi:SAM-dependent methyltransferase
MTLRLPDSGAEVLPDGRRVAPSALRNAGPIVEALVRDSLPTGAALEIASGTGQHSVQLARACPGLDWQPSDVNPANLASIAAWGAHDPQPNLRAPIVLDACRPGWGAGQAGKALILIVNLLHLVPDEAAAVLIGELPAALAPGGVVAIYGPFLRDGKPTSEGDAAFHARLREQDARLGYKDLDWVLKALGAAGLAITDTVSMPANNLMLFARKPAF